MGIGHARGRLYAWREDGLLAAHAGREDRQQPAWAVDWAELDWQWPDGAGHWARLCCCQCVFENKQVARLGLTCGLGLGLTWPVEAYHSLGHAACFAEPSLGLNWAFGN